MNWVAVDINLKNNNKVKALRNALKLSNVYEAMGRLQAFWGWCFDNATEEGILRNCTEEDIAEAFGWRDAGQLIRALTAKDKDGRAGFLEITADGEYLVHDWAKEQAMLYRNRRVRAYDNNRKKPGKPAEIPVDSTPEKQPEVPTEIPTKKITDKQQENSTEEQAEIQTDNQAEIPTANRNLNQDRNLNLTATADARACEDGEGEPPEDVPPAEIEDKFTCKCYGHYERSIGILAPRARDWLSSYLDDGIEDALICAAITECTAVGVRKWSYLNKILDECYREGCLTLADFNRRREKFESSKARASPGKRNKDEKEGGNADGVQFGAPNDELREKYGI